MQRRVVKWNRGVKDYLDIIVLLVLKWGKNTTIDPDSLTDNNITSSNRSSSDIITVYFKYWYMLTVLSPTTTHCDK